MGSYFKQKKSQIISLMNTNETLETVSLIATADKVPVMPVATAIIVAL